MAVSRAAAGKEGMSDGENASGWSILGEQCGREWAGRSCQDTPTAATRRGASPHAARPSCSRCAPCPQCSRPSSCRRCTTPRRRARCASILKPDDAARLRRSQALRSGLRQDTVGRAYSRAGLTPWTAQVDQLPKWQDGQRAKPQRRIAAPAPDCASHCNEGCEPTPRRLGPPTQRPLPLPTLSPTRPMCPIVGASASSGQFRPLPAHRADLTFPVQRPPWRFSPTRFI